MGAYIKGMEMPKEGEWISVNISPGGKCFIQSWCGKDFNFAEKLTAVTVPPHGRLIEESKVLDIVSTWCPDDDGSVGKVGDLREMLDEIEALPTIIPAEEGE